MPTGSNVAGMQDGGTRHGGPRDEARGGRDAGGSRRRGLPPPWSPFEGSRRALRGRRAIDLLLAKLGGRCAHGGRSHGRSRPARACRGRPGRRATGAGHRGRMRAAGQPGPASDPTRERLAALSDRAGAYPRLGGVRVGACGLRHDRSQRRPQQAGAPRCDASARGRGSLRQPARCLLHDLRRRHARRHLRQVRAGDRGRAPGGQGRAR